MSKYQNEVLNFHNQTFLLKYAWKTIICLNNMLFWLSVGFLHNSVCKESACNADSLPTELSDKPLSLSTSSLNTSLSISYEVEYTPIQPQYHYHT